MQQQNIISSSCRATPTKYTHNFFSHLLQHTLLISFIFLSVLIEAAPTPPFHAVVPNLQSFAYYSAAAYCKVPLQGWNCGEVCVATPGTELIKVVTNDKRDTKGFIALDKDEELIIVSYRGTVPGNVKNLLTDLNFFTKKYPPVDNTKVHSGFYNAFLDLQPDVTDAVIKLHQDNPNFKIGFMGHSLGGAIATFSALDVVQKVPELANNDQLFLATFGQPRVGDVVFAQYAKENLKTIRTIVRGDPIPRLPPAFPIPFVGLYQHFGDEYYLDKPDEDPESFIACSAEDPQCSASVPLLQLRTRYHTTPYYGVSMKACTDQNEDGDKELEDYDYSLDPNFYYDPNYNYSAPVFGVYGAKDKKGVNGVDGGVSKEVDGNDVEVAKSNGKGVDGSDDNYTPKNSTKSITPRHGPALFYF